MATVYKSTTYKAVNNRSVTPATSARSSAIATTLGSFITYFKAKHL
jgi:hypothetical protein